MLGLLCAPALALYTLIFPSMSGPSDTRDPHHHRGRKSGSLEAKVVEVPTSLIDVLSAATDFDGKCHPVSHAGWSHEAEECTYIEGGRSFTITTATPSAERAATWIVDASTLIPSVDGLRARDRGAWEDALAIIGKQTIAQSGRVFPLDGVIWENFEGLTGYVFHDGVTYGTFGGPLATCRACACRIDSLNRSQWCSYTAEVLGGETYAACMDHLGGDTGWNDAWAEQCVANHESAWNTNQNDSYRAVAYFIERHQMGPQFRDAATANPSDVVAALARAYAKPYLITVAHEPR
jgi:hypothetical protein